MLRPAALLLVAVLAAGCSSSDDGGPAAAPGTPPPGGLSEQALRGLLLETADAPGTTTRRDSASTAGTTAPAPQLALCRTPSDVGVHQVANVLLKPAKAGEAQVFELVQAFTDEAGASAALSSAVDAATACPTFTAEDVTFTVQDLRRPAVAGADDALQYRLTTPDVVRGDVRTVVRAGRFVVLVTGFGAPPGGQDALDYQADVAAKAVARLPAR